MFELIKRNINLGIILCSIIFFLFKWSHPIIHFNEDLDVTLIFESASDGYYYFPTLKALANFDLTNSYDPFIGNLNNTTIPTGAFAIHSILYIFFGLWSFVISELIFITVFFIIFYKISRLLNFSRLGALTISIILFNIPNLLQILGIANLEYITVIFSEFYSFRFPRPLVSNIFFFLFILFILKAKRKKIFTNKNSIILGSISALSFTSYFHTFLLEQILLLSFLFFIFGYQLINKLKDNIRYIIIYILSFIILSSPALLNMFYSEPDYLERIGLIKFDYEKKIFLFKYLFYKLFKIEFLLVFFMSLLLLIIVNLKHNINKFKKINIFFIVFYTSIISPFIYIIISPSFFSHFYLFNNLIIISFFLLFFFTIFQFIKFYSKNILSIKVSNCLAFFIILIFFGINFYQTSKNYNNYHLDNKNFQQRKEFNSITSIIKNINILKNNNISFLTFDNKFLVWAILKNTKYLNIVNGVFISKTHKMIEDDLINNFKYLKLNKNDFEEFIKNKKLSSWRYRNENIKNLFWMRYQANSMITFNDSDNFEPEILEFIKKSSPILSQQLIIPNEEIERLALKFDSEIDSILTEPLMIVINKKNPVLNRSVVNLNNFCKAFEGEFYDFYYSLRLYSKCNK